jgi:hypothetical protein
MCVHPAAEFKIAGRYPTRLGVMGWIPTNDLNHSRRARQPFHNIAIIVSITIIIPCVRVIEVLPICIDFAYGEVTTWTGLTESQVTCYIAICTYSS